MMYISLRQWRDLSDGHLYAAGDAFPHDGREISPARLAELTSTANKARERLIEAVPAKGEDSPIQEEKTAQKPARGRKKAAK